MTRISFFFHRLMKEGSLGKSFFPQTNSFFWLSCYTVIFQLEFLFLLQKIYAIANCYAHTLSESKSISNSKWNIFLKIQKLCSCCSIHYFRFRLISLFRNKRFALTWKIYHLLYWQWNAWKFVIKNPNISFSISNHFGPLFKMKKKLFGFLFLNSCKIWSISLDNLIKHKFLIMFKDRLDTYFSRNLNI